MVQYDANFKSLITRLSNSHSLSLNHRMCPRGFWFSTTTYKHTNKLSGPVVEKEPLSQCESPLNPGRLEKHEAKQHVVHPCRMFGPITQIGFLFQYYFIAPCSAKIHEAFCGPLRSGRWRSTEMKTLIELFAHNAIDLFCRLAYVRNRRKSRIQRRLLLEFA